VPQAGCTAYPSAWRTAREPPHRPSSAPAAPAHHPQPSLYSTEPLSVLCLLRETREELIEQFEITVMHEVEHLVGLDEDALWECGLDRGTGA
jgi:Zincin-like metallopeptidase